MKFKEIDPKKTGCGSNFCTAKNAMVCCHTCEEQGNCPAKCLYYLQQVHQPFPIGERTCKSLTPVENLVWRTLFGDKGRTP